MFKVENESQLVVRIALQLTAGSDSFNITCNREKNQRVNKIIYNSVRPRTWTDILRPTRVIISGTDTLLGPGIDKLENPLSMLSNFQFQDKETCLREITVGFQ